jgi:hypothetical protein
MSTGTSVFFFSSFEFPRQGELPGTKCGGSMLPPLSVTKHLWSNSPTGAVLKLLEIEILTSPGKLSGLRCGSLVSE